MGIPSGEKRDQILLEGEQLHLPVRGLHGYPGLSPTASDRRRVIRPDHCYIPAELIIECIEIMYIKTRQERRVFDVQRA
jgi:hypothetical protein